MDLGTVSVDDFAPLVGQQFTIDGGVLGAIELELIDASTHDPGVAAVDDSGTRAPFTATFRGPAEPMLAQQTCPLENDILGRLEIFIVPVGQDELGARYEAVFA